MALGARKLLRLKHHGRRTVVQERYQRPDVKDAGTNWKIFYWDYTEPPRRKRSKTWAKSSVPSQREAQRLADQFMERVNARNNEPHLFANDDETVQTLYEECQKLTWPHLKNSTREHYEYAFKTYVLPEFGNMKLLKLTTIELQSYFNSLRPPRLAPKTIKGIHGSLRAALNQGIAWGKLERNPAVGVKLPRRRSVKAPVLLPLVAIGKVLRTVPEPTRSLLIFMVFASMRVGEALALRWKDVFPDRILVDERVYDGEFDDVKTEAGEREVPFDRHGVVLEAVKVLWDRNKSFRKPDDLVFANEKGNPLDRHNLLHRHLKPAVKKLGLPKEVDFRSFRTMHASLMRRMGGRLEVARDNMGHAGSTGSVTLDVYSKTWWDERVDAVTRVVEAVMTEPEEKEEAALIDTRKPIQAGEEWVPFWVPNAV
jgi:integrase